MNSTNESYPTADTLMAMRHEEDAIYAICAKLKVKEMGCYDHIVTKHEVRDWLKAGGTDRAEAEAIVNRSLARRAEARGRALWQARGQEERQGWRVPE